MIHKRALAIGFAATTASALAGPIKFEFDANTFLDVTPTTAEALSTQANPRLMVANGAVTATRMRTYTGTAVQPDELNGYLNWVDSLGSSGEGITAFNMWVTTASYPNNPYDSPTAGAWAQGIYRDGTLGNSATGISATAPTGWTATVVDVYAGTYGVSWHTNNPALSLRPTSLGGTDFSNFSFTMADTNAVVGQNYRVWFGLGNSSTGSQLTYDNVGWGDRPTTFSPSNSILGSGGSPGSVWNGVIEVSATAVPEPAILGAIGLAGVLVCARRRRI